ncbi:acyl-CoA thioester hydrolase/BAAT C-terminal domain-containing protein [Streptomyces murinus]
MAALSPSPLVWCNVGPGRDGAERPYRSCWTWRGRPLPFVPMDDSWTPAEPEDGPVAIRGWYERSERTFAELLPAAEIPVEAARAELILVAGGDDAMWPSVPYAERLAERRRSAGAGVRLITRADAGHRPFFPSELAPPPSPVFRYGGTPEADALLGAAAWPHLLDALRG